MGVGCVVGCVFVVVGGGRRGVVYIRFCCGGEDVDDYFVLSGIIDAELCELFGWVFEGVEKSGNFVEGVDLVLNVFADVVVMEWILEG